MPSISSYSASPFRQRLGKTPFPFHSEKYLGIELALPNSYFGNALHWQAVRETKMIAHIRYYEDIFSLFDFGALIHQFLKPPYSF
jgi:hypothetical protein